ncbi:MAG: HAMP domain-containing sensor histidine kinase [Pseudomonadota bacterium]
MSSPTRERLLHSAVLRLTMQAVAAFIVVAIGLGALLGAWRLAAVDRDEREDLEATAHFLREVYEEAGVAGLIEELRDDEGLLWSEWHTLLRVWEHEPIALLLDENSPRVGYAELDDVDDWAWQTLALEDDDGGDNTVRVRTLNVPLARDLHVIVAAARGWHYEAYRDGLRAGLFWLLGIALPLSLITGYTISRLVFGRLQALSAVAAQIGEGQLHRRVPLREPADEFDRLGASFNLMLDRLEALHRNIQDVSVGIAHDLKTPVTHLDQRLRLLEHDLDERDLALEHLEQAHSEIASLLRTFEGLLRLGEIESGRRRTAFTRVDLSQLLIDLSESFEPVFTEHERALEHSIIPGITIQGDVDLLTQMVTNLLENSVEHGRPGGRSWLRLQTSARGAVLQVGDDGPGIAQEHHAQLFDRFYRADKSRSTPGNGLGLSIARAVCTLHGAHIEVQPGQPGAVFDIHFIEPGSPTPHARVA